MRLQVNLRSFFMLVVVGCITPAIVLHAPMLHAGTIDIDDFSAPATEENFTSIDLGALPSFVGTQPTISPVAGEASILGGSRNATVQVQTPVDWKSAMGTIGNGAFSVFTGGSSGSVVTIDYPGLTDVDLTDGGTNQSIALDFNFVEPGDLNLQIVITDGANTATFDSSTTANIPGSGTPFTYLATFADFDMAAPLSSADSISVVLNGPAVANMDFELSSISAVTAVPEPSTMAMLLTLVLASLSLIVRRR